MYSTKVVLSHYTVYLEFSEAPYKKYQNSIIFGFPINLKDISLNIKNSVLGNTIKGYWLKIDLEDNKIVITNDILGGYRLYYYIENNVIYLSDDYSRLLNRIKKLRIKKNEIEFDFWLKHRYTTGKSTFINGLNKLSPASILEISDNSIVEKSYFRDVERTSNAIKHKITIHQDLLETFSLIKESKHKIILLFSGGKDSCLLLQYLLYFKISFTPIFFKLNPISTFGIEDLKRVRSVAKELGLNLEEIEIKLSDISPMDKRNILEKQLFDRHFSLLHYQGSKIINERYGNKCLVVNGQSSDSIFSFGPSENSIMSYFRRNLMYKPKAMISKLGLLLLMLKTKKKFKSPTNNETLLFALFDEYKYTRVIDKQVNKNYIDYINNYINIKTKQLKSFYSKEMYVKILSFCQGSDNQVVVNSSKSNNILTIMPFATPNIIYNTIKYKDENLEIKKPKYIVERILEEEFSFYYNSLKLRQIDVSDISTNFNIDAFNIEMDYLFQEKALNIFSKS